VRIDLSSFAMEKGGLGQPPFSESLEREVVPSLSAVVRIAF